MDDIRLIIVDDHPSVRLGLEAILNKTEGITVVGVASGGRSALDLCRRTRPDVALVDMFMPIMDGVETIKLIRAEFPSVQCIVLTYSDSENLILSAIDAGAIGYLLKNAELPEVTEAIRAAAEGRRVLSPEALEVLIRGRSTASLDDRPDLTDREQEILDLLAAGKINTEIAEQLYLSVSTVKFHARMIFRKLGARTRTEAVVKAIDLGLTKPKQ